MKQNNKIKIAIVQRVIFHYRVNFFSKIADSWETIIFHGKSVPGTKVVNAKLQGFEFKHKKLITLCKSAKSNPQQILYFNPGLVWEFIKWNPDVILLEGSNNMLNNIFVYIYCRVTRKRYIWWGIGQVPGRKDSIYRRFLTPFRKHIIKKATSVLAYCDLSADYFKSITSNKAAVKVLPNSLDNNKIESEIAKITDEDKASLRKKLNISDNKVVLLFVGALERNKNLDVLFDATKELTIRGKEVETFIIGGGSACEAYKSYAKSLQLQNCRFLGKIINGVNIYFQIADIFVLPGRGGLAINQALINGLPVVCKTPADGTELDMITNGYNGYLIKEMNAMVLADCLDMMISNDLYVKMGAKSKQIIRGRYNIDVMIRVLSEAVTACCRPK